MPPDRCRLRAALKPWLRRYVVERRLSRCRSGSFAIELAKIALWIETMDRELPFSFLDHSSRGNAPRRLLVRPLQALPHRRPGSRGGDKSHHHRRFANGRPRKAIAEHLKDVIKPDLSAIDRMRRAGGPLHRRGKTAEEGPR